MSEADGLLLVDKPAGRTSHDVVDLARRALRTRKVGHAGTLDPFATGLLVLLVGRATRLAPFLNAEPKVYEATFRFGADTDSDDATGAVSRVAPLPSESALRAALPQFTGTILQRPPTVSAKQVGGVRAHAAARIGTPLDLTPVAVRVFAWDDVVITAESRTAESRTAESLTARITCAGGTYIRALARDLARAVGSAGHCVALRRTRIGAFGIADAIPALELAERAQAALRSPVGGLDPSLTRESIDADACSAIAHGRAVPARSPGARAALLGPEGALVAIAERQGDLWHPNVVLAHA